MPNMRTLQRSFGGGEVTPEFYGRLDNAQYQTGVAQALNFLILPHGPAANRAGTQFVRAVKDSAKRTRVLPFTFSTTQTFAIELGAGYFRWHTQGATLLAPAAAAYNDVTTYGVGDLAASGGTTYYCTAPTTGNAPPNASYWYALPASGEYEIPNPYAEAELFEIHFVQSNDVLTLVHPNHAPRELRRYGATDWRLATILFASLLEAPAGVGAAATTGTGTTTYSYKVTALGEGGLDESPASAAASADNDLLTTGNKNTVSWSAVTGAQRYNVYKESNGLYGYIGQTDGLSFIDDNIGADLSKTPPLNYDPFTGAGNYPAAVSYYGQRRCFAGTTNRPQNLWMTRPGTESNMTYSLPGRDDDAINVRVAAREANTIRHLVPLDDLILLTSAAEWRASSRDSGVITPSSIDVRPQSYVGANDTQPLLINSNLLYVAALGGHVQELGFDNVKASAYVSGDLSLRAPHLFDRYDVVDMAYAKAPYPIVWCVSTSGKLLGITYVPNQQVGAWHQHATDGEFESVTAVTEGTESVAYFVVKRTIDGNVVRYVERMAGRAFSSLAHAYFVDCGLTYDGAPTTTIAGLDHLEGREVSILADGAVHPRRTVSGGQITLEVAASVVHVGLPITADLVTLPLAMQIDPGMGQGRQKNINRVFMRVHESSGIWAGPDAGSLTEYKQRVNEPYGTPPALQSKEIEIVVDPDWNDNGQIMVRQVDPLPITVMTMSMEVSIGG